MKAAVLEKLGKAPIFKEYPEPVLQNEEQVIMHVKAASVKNIDKLRAGGKHYASYTSVPVVVGLDGVGVLEDGTKIYAQGLTGMIAEKAVISKYRYTVLPENIDYNIAAALPNAIIGSAMALKFRADMQPGNVVLINGATGVTGSLAVQVAKHYGASKIIVTGRNHEQLEKLRNAGADHIISLKQDDEAIIEQLKTIHQQDPINIVIDYLWGHPIELIISSLKGSGINSFSEKVRIVTVGDMAGEAINLTSGTLRSSAIELLGSGLGSFSLKEMIQFNAEILPEMFQLAADGILTMDLQVELLENIESIWEEEISPGKRVVIAV